MNEELNVSQAKLCKLEEAARILNLLCDLKRHKDEHGKDEFYLKEQPKLWDQAFKITERINLS